MRILQFGVVAVLGLMLALVGLPIAYAQADAEIRIVHAVPDAPAVDVYVDGTAVAEGVGFFTASNYLPLAAGEHRIQVTAAGTPADQSVISTTVDLAAGQAYTVAASGTLATIEATVLQDDRTIPTAGDTKIRFVHLVPGAPAVDVRRVGADQDVPIVNNLPFQEASDYIPLLPGNYDFNIVATGTDQVVLDFNEDIVADAPIYDVFLVGELPNIQAQVISPAAAQPAQAQQTPQATMTMTAAATTEATAEATTEATVMPTTEATVMPTTAATEAATTQATTEPVATATPQTPTQLPTTGGYSGALFSLTLMAAILIGVGLFVRRRR
ncbi:MAG: DUF4397 domain-containing protein [Oscillochloris sp.]|nr:DUF4397 domain-containing protein [Oscillochloris sp.]